MDAEELQDLMLQAPTRTLPVTVVGWVIGMRYVETNIPIDVLGSPYDTRAELPFVALPVATEVLVRFSPKGEPVWVPSDAVTLESGDDE
jgi:hypothetical protein